MKGPSTMTTQRIEFTANIDGSDYDVNATLERHERVMSTTREHFGHPARHSESEIEFEIDTFNAFDQGGHEVFEDQLIGKIEGAIRQYIDDNYISLAFSL